MSQSLLTDPALLARWNGDGNGDDTGDLINAANPGTFDGTWVGSASYLDGQYPGVKAFNCNDARYFTINGPTITGNLTFTATIKTSVSVITDQIAHFYQQSTPFPGWGVRHVDGAIQFWCGDGAWRVSQSSDYNSGVLVAIACVYNGSTVSFYKNGVFDGSQAAPASLPTYAGTKSIGAVNNGSSVFGGTIEDVRIYDRALSGAEVLAIANGQEFVPGGATLARDLTQDLTQDLTRNILQ